MAALCVLSVADLSAQGVLTGRVADEATGLALPGANIAVSSTRLGASSDADGNFRIVGLSAGTYLLEASFIGYKSKQVAVIVPADLKTGSRNPFGTRCFSHRSAGNSRAQERVQKPR